MASESSQSWYRSAFEKAYLALYAHRDLGEAAQVTRMLSERLGLTRSHRLLDLCCGPGRHLVFLRECVGEAVGFDLSAALLNYAAEHLRETLMPDTIERATLVRGNMRHLPFAPASFDRVVNLFTSFGYFKTDDENASVLTEVGRLLCPGGRFAIDHINREHLLAHFTPRSERTLSDGSRVDETRHWRVESERVEKDVVLTRPDGSTLEWNESVRVFEPESLEAMLIAAGLRPIERLGNYTATPWTPQSERLIILAERM